MVGCMRGFFVCSSLPDAVASFDTGAAEDMAAAALDVEAVLLTFALAAFSAAAFFPPGTYPPTV